MSSWDNDLQLLIKVWKEKKTDAQKYKLGMSQDLHLNVSALGLSE